MRQTQGVAIACAVFAVAATADSARAQRANSAHPYVEDDDAARARSKLWESALDPQRAAYEQLVADGRRRLQRRTKESARLAVAVLDDAIARIPSDGRAYALRGQAHLVLEHWPECASDLATAMRTTGAALDRDRAAVDLGICQGRAEQLGEAEQTLAGAASRAQTSEPWMRLGEIRIALGKLDAAIEALEIALEKQDPFRPYIEWLLAIATDRAARPSEAELHAARALSYDATFNCLVVPRYPWLRVGDREYALGLAHRASDGPEYALGHFRSFLRLATQSPWRHRVEQHVRELARLKLPQVLRRDPESSAPIELAALRPAIAKAMPALHACLVDQPITVFTIAITRVGNQLPTSVRDRPGGIAPLAGTRATPGAEVESQTSGVRTDTAETAARDRVSRCLERIADRILLPAPRVRGTWYRARFAVVAP